MFFLFSSHQTKEVVWIHPQSTVQFSTEGYYFGALNLGAAACGIAAVHIVPRIKDRSFRNTVLVAASAGFYLLVQRMILTYTSKNRWYQKW